MSFFNQDFYVDVVTRWEGCGMLYMLVACAAATVFTILPISSSLIGTMNNPQLVEFFQQIPQVTFNDGHVTIDKQTPYQIKDHKSGVVIAEFRTDKTGSPTIGEGDPPIIVTRDVIEINDPEGPKTYQFADLTKMTSTFTFNGTDLNNLMKTLAIAVPLSGFLFGVPLMWIGHVLQMCIFAGAALVAFSSMQVPLKFGTGMRLAAIAITPNIIISSLLNLLAIPAPRVASNMQMLWMLGSLILPIVLIVIAAQACKAAQAAESAQAAEAR
jgi:hypothetical protein